MPGKLDDYLTVSRSLVMPMSSLSAMFFVYGTGCSVPRGLDSKLGFFFFLGLYTALFISYIRILRCRRRRNQAKTLYFWPTIALFFLATLVVIGETIYRSIGAYITFNAVQTKNFKALKHYLRHDPRKTTGMALTNICAVLLKYV
ncbi:hypothetical protein WG66_006466 [Moniliophthora roreri]|nr:hypothetical protein WG66_006466 [Moniliophthora roreri]